MSAEYEWTHLHKSDIGDIFEQMVSHLAHGWEIEIFKPGRHKIVDRAIIEYHVIMKRELPTKKKK